jgi:acyl-CoA thioester hydrolase
VTRRPTPRLEDFPGRVTENIRYGDLDPQNHVNNAVFSTFFETGRVNLFRDPVKGLLVAGANFVLARSEIDFLRELKWPGSIEIGTGIAAIGRSSYTVAQAIFREGQCAAMGRATIVLIDNESRRPRPLSEEAIARLKQFRTATFES